jgi:C1A family cysteine protease
MREEIKQNGDTFEVGINSAMQYPLEELCSLNPDFKVDDSSLLGINEQENISNVAGLAMPPTFTGYYTPVENVMICGPWAFITCDLLEGIILGKDGVLVNLSEQYLIDCNIFGYNCNNGWFCHDMHMFPYGARSESCYPYKGVQGPCNQSCPWVYRISNWGYVLNSSSVPTPYAIKLKIYTYGAVACCVNVDSYFQAYTSGCFSHNSSGPVNHFVLLVGWDDTKCTTGAWRLKNNWGTGWGEAGFMWIKYGVSSVGYAANYVVYP